MTTIPVVDIFAGPGGLGEGFSAFEHRGTNPFKIGLSVEKDAVAHQTLRLRAFARSFRGGSLPAGYHEIIRGERDATSLHEIHKGAAGEAEAEAICMALGSEEAESDLPRRIRALTRKSDKWILIGGPPCQAYSVAGRSRNKGIKGYDPSKDERQTLYHEYLKILAEHEPAAFVMENVKGLLSAELRQKGIFEIILSELSEPGRAVRGPRTSKPKYRLYALSPRTKHGVSSRQFCLMSDQSEGTFEPEDFIVKSELFGVPQARHRVIILGIRDDLRAIAGHLIPADTVRTVESVIGDLPRLRSAVSGKDASYDRWSEVLSSARKTSWLKQVRSDNFKVYLRVMSSLDELDNRDTKGSEFAPFGRRKSRSVWVGDDSLGGIANHVARSHMESDLHRYLFSASYGAVIGRSPSLKDFPKALLPEHANVNQALKGGYFGDRFRVQVANRPSTTITSHISKDGHYYIHPDPTQCRSLTVREAARLQTFPDDYFFCGGRTSQYHQVGNAVPPFLARQIAAIVHRALNED